LPRTIHETVRIFCQQPAHPKFGRSENSAAWASWPNEGGLTKMFGNFTHEPGNVPNPYHLHEFAPNAAGKGSPRGFAQVRVSSNPPQKKVSRHTRSRPKTTGGWGGWSSRLLRVGESTGAIPRRIAHFPFGKRSKGVWVTRAVGDGKAQRSAKKAIFGVLREKNPKCPRLVAPLRRQLLSTHTPLDPRVIFRGLLGARERKQITSGWSRTQNSARESGENQRNEILGAHAGGEKLAKFAPKGDNQRKKSAPVPPFARNRGNRPEPKEIARTRPPRASPRLPENACRTRPPRLDRERIGL
jgi:hypothetical protein